MATRDTHSETMVKKVVRAEVGLLRDDWFLPVLAAALDKALVYVGSGYNLHWREAARRALDETYAEFNIEGLAALIGDQAPALETASAA
jgi:hypothetical protein